MSPVTIVDVSNVTVPAEAATLPEPIKLNAMEAQWLVFPLLQHILFYDGDKLPSFDTVVASLKSALSATLATYAPLAGKLHYLADTGDVGIVCSASNGIRFVVAESEADIHRLAGDEELDVQTFEQLVPEVNMGELPTPLLAVQATRLQGGGVAIGITIHHAVADGRSLWRFVEAWAAACRGDKPPTSPVFDRSRVSLPAGDELARSVLQKYVPNLPVASMPSYAIKDRIGFARRTFTCDAEHIQRLKQRIVWLGEVQGAPLLRPPSSFVSVIALAWTSFARSRPFPANEDVFLIFFADVRDRLNPPAGAEYFGVCLSLCLARLPAREFHTECALAAAASAVQGAVREMAENPLGGWDFMSQAGVLPVDRLMNVSGSSSFKAYDVADFRWGRPRRSEQVVMNPDGQVALVQARDGKGVQMSVSVLQQAHMDAFKSEFLNLLA